MFINPILNIHFSDKWYLPSNSVSFKMDGKGFVPSRSNRKQNRNKNAIVLQCIRAKMQETFPGIPAHLCRDSVHTYIPRVSTAGGVRTLWCSDGLLAVPCDLSWGELALLGGGSLCDVVRICERWTISYDKYSCTWYGFKLLESGLSEVGTSKWPSYGIRRYVLGAVRLSTDWRLDTSVIGNVFLLCWAQGPALPLWRNGELHLEV